jgi:hypothetical protein
MKREEYHEYKSGRDMEGIDRDIKLLLQHLRGENDENHEHLQSG